MSSKKHSPSDSQHKIALIRQIGTYRLLKKIHSDEKGDIYRARHTDEAQAAEQGGDVALTIVPPEISKDKSFQQKCMEAMEFGIKFQHPCIVQIYEVNTQGSSLYVVMEWVDGTSLFQLLSTKSWSLKESIKLLYPIAKALDYIHRFGGEHLGLNPQNILIGEDGRPRITGFGTSPSTLHFSLQETGEKNYETAYIAPEQVDNWHTGPVLDRYAFGIIFYELCTQTYPWKPVLSDAHILAHKQQGKLIPASQQPQNQLSARQSEALMKMLSVRPDRRYFTCCDLIAAVLGKESDSLDEAELQTKKKAEKEILPSKGDLSVPLSAIETKISEAHTQIQRLVKERDKGFAELESRFEAFYEAIKKETEAVKQEVEFAHNELLLKFRQQRQEKLDVLTVLEDNVNECQRNLKDAEQELESREGSFFSVFSRGKNSKIHKKRKKREIELQRANLSLFEGQKAIAMELSQLQKKEKSVLSQLDELSEKKLETAEERAESRMQQAKVQFHATRKKYIAQYNNTRYELDQRLHTLLRRKNLLEGKKTGHSKNQNTDTLKEGQIRQLVGLQVEFCLFLQEKFWRGAEEGDSDAIRNEYPRHQVSLINSFWASTTPVTQELYHLVMKNNPSKFQHKKHPVESVTWFQAIEFCNRLSKLAGFNPVYLVNAKKKIVIWDREARGYRLPTEAEWELMAGRFILSDTPNSTTRKIDPNHLNRVAWHKGNSSNSTQKVTLKAANCYGLYDIIGNVWEWCWDWYGAYPATTVVDPTGAEKGTRRIRRGGSWRNKAPQLRVTHRSHANPQTKSAAVGFRVVCDLQKDP